MTLTLNVTPFRFGLLTDGTSLRPWQRDCVAMLLRTPEVVADCWLQSSDARQSPIDPFTDAIGRLRSQNAPASYATLGPHDLDALSGRGLHFILSFAQTAAARSLTDQAKWGVWQFFFGDWERYGGDSAGFWEIVDDEACASALLGQLQTDAALVRVLKQGHIRSHPCLPSVTRRRLEARCAHWPLQICLEACDTGGSLFERPPVHATPASRRRGTWSTRLAFSARAVLRSLREINQELLQHEQWNIGLIDAPIAAVATSGSPAPRWLKRPRSREFFADPFAITHDGRLFVFCEYMDYRKGQGSIVAFAADAPDYVMDVDVGPAVHRSYPYLFESEGRIYCIPETQEAMEIALYEPESFPQRWRRVTTIASGRPFMDATVFRYEERWWLAAGLAVPKGAESELHLFYADALTGPWQPHRANPVKVDVQTARPAGTPFFRDGILYRPGQDCSRVYGGRVVINRVVRLTEQSYLEESCSSIEPLDSGPYSVGLHTLSSAGSATLIDSKRNVFVPAQFVTVLRQILKTITAR